MMLRKRDLLWLLLLPLYLIIGTFRHELAHAIIARAQGAEILEFAFWPSFYKDGTFYYGYVLWRGETTWLVDAAPYFFDIITYGAFYPLVYLIQYRKRWLWLNLVIIGLISPLVNTLHNYLRGSDVRNLLAVFPHLPVHGFFLLGLGLGLFGLVLVFTRSKQALASFGSQDLC
jgi:glycosyltransferase involved in cell wall biosynthesis